MAKKYIPKLYDSDEVTLIDDIHDVIECKIREERNGIFELTLDYPASSPLLYEFKKERVIVANASPKLRNQMFVIYKVCRYMKKKIKVIARHISFDLLYDSCSELKLENASCEYVLNSLFRNSRFSREFRGFSDIINAQNYSIENVNILEAIAGKEGSIIDTFGTGAEILRDNKNFHVLKKRGHDNGVSIEYGINLTGFECYEDTTDLVTCIKPFATYRNEDSTETTVRGDFVESPRAGNYKHLYIKHIDYTNKFEAKEVPTPTKLNELAAQDFRTSSMDVPKMRYEIKFIPLSQCVGYENFQDAIGLCDIVTVKNRVYNVDDKAKVVATVFDPIKDRYESMELGEPRSTLGSILSGSDGKDGQNGKDGKDGKDGQDGNVENMPDTLPETPVLYSKVYGMGGVELSWSFENKLYYNYELYASIIPDFNPTSFDLIHSGQSSSHFFKANPGETWYFRVCAINSHSKRTPFSNQVDIKLPKEEDMNNYFSEMAIGKAVVQSLSADYMEAGIIKAHWIELKGASVIDGNGKRTFDIDSFGRITLMPSVFKMMIDGKEEDVATKSQLTQVENKLQFKIEQSGNQNYGSNTDFSKGLAGWETYNSNYISSVAGGWNVPVGSGAYIVGQGDKAVYLKQTVKVPPKAEKYYASAYLNCTNFLNIGGRPEESLWHFYVVLRYTDGTGETKKVPCWDENHAQGSWKRKYIEFIRDINKTVESIETYLYVRYVEGNFYISMVKTETDQLGAWVQGIHEINTEIVELDDRGIWCKHQNGSAMNANSQSVDFTNENGRKKMSAKNGGLNYYNFQSGLFVGLDSSTQFSDEFSKFGMQKFASKHCSFYDILHSPTTETDDNLKLANSVFRICFENIEGPTDYRSVKGIHSFLTHRFHEGIDMTEKPIQSCGTIYMGTNSTRNKVTYDDMYDEMQIGCGGGGVILGKTKPDGSVEHAIKIFEDYYIDTFRDWNFQGCKIENANIISNFAPTPMLRSFAYIGNDSYTNLIDKVDVVTVDTDKLALTKKEYDGGSSQFSETQLLYAAVEKIKELENTISILNEEINNMKGVV